METARGKCEMKLQQLLVACRNGSEKRTVLGLGMYQGEVRFLSENLPLT